MIRTWANVEDDGSTGMNVCFPVVVVKAKLSSGSNRRTGLTKALINSVSANRLFYGPLYPPFLAILGLTFHGRHE